jgi:hypothetical protein
MQISCFQCDLRLLFAWIFRSQCVITIENYTNSEMTDMVLCCGSALRAQALYRKKFPPRRVPHSQTFLSVVQRLRESGSFRPKSVDRGQEQAPRVRVLDLEPQIQESVEENPSTSTRQLAREARVATLSC